MLNIYKHKNCTDVAISVKRAYFTFNDEAEWTFYVTWWNIVNFNNFMPIGHDVITIKDKDLDNWVLWY